MAFPYEVKSLNRTIYSNFPLSLLLILPFVFHMPRLYHGQLGVAHFPGGGLLFFLLHRIPPPLQYAHLTPNHALRVDTFDKIRYNASKQTY